MNLKEYFKNKITSLKCWIKEYLLLKNSLEHFENFIKKYCFFSVGFNDIYYGNKNMKRFIICIVNWAFLWFAIGFDLSFVLSDKMFSLIDVLSTSGQNLKLFLLLGAIMLLLIAVLRADVLLGEINYNLNSFKVLYYLMKDLKELHKLNEKNYKLAILSRSIQIVFMDYARNLLVITLSLFIVKIGILSGKIFWILGIIIFILIFIAMGITTASVTCLYIIMLSYYALIFSQINHQINLISNEKSTFFKRRKLIINKTKQRQLISLIHEHNLTAIEIHKFNLMVRRSVGCLFITFAMIKIISLYLMVNINEFFIKLFLIQFNFFLDYTWIYALLFIHFTN